MDKESIKKLSDKELWNLLNEADWMDRDLVREYDERSYNKRDQLKPIDDLEEHFRKRRERKAKEKLL